eukprot:gene7159-11472_t
MEKEIKNLAQQLGFEKTKRITNKSVELLRLLQVKCPYGLPGHGEVSKNMICIEISTILLKIPNFPKELAIRLSGVTSKEYQQNFTWIQNKLELKFSISPSDFCVKMGCTGIISFVTEVFEFFKKSYLEDLPEQRRKFVDFSNLIFIGSVLYLCAKSSKFNIDKKSILGEIGCSEHDFNAICEVVSLRCEKLLKETKTSIELKKPKKKTKKKIEESKTLESKEEKKIEETQIKEDKVEESKGSPTEIKEKIKDVKENQDEENVKKRKFEEIQKPQVKVKSKKRKQVTLHYFQSEK